MGQVIYPGVPRIIKITVLSGELTGSAAHNMGTTPDCGKPNANVSDNVGNAYASANDTTVTVTCDVPVSQDTIFRVLVIV